MWASAGVPPRLVLAVEAVFITSWAVATAYLLRRVRRLEKVVATSATEAQLEQLTHRLAALEQKVDTSRRLPPPPAPVAASASFGAQSATIARAPSWESMKTDEQGYKTADEDIDEGAEVASSPVKIDDWAARSVYGDNSWSCVVGGVSSEAPSGGGAASGGAASGASGGVVELEERTAFASTREGGGAGDDDTLEMVRVERSHDVPTSRLAEALAGARGGR